MAERYRSRAGYRGCSCFRCGRRNRTERDVLAWYAASPGFVVLCRRCWHWAMLMDEGGP